jgi:DNA-binding NtrC family response regulator
MEQALMRVFDELVEKFEMFEMALTEFISRRDDIESTVRSFMNTASRAGKNTHRLRISDNLRRQIVERLYPGFLSKTRPDVFRGLLADVLENHVVTVLGLQRHVNGKAAGTQHLTETLTERTETS